MYFNKYTWSNFVWEDIIHEKKKLVSFVLFDHILKEKEDVIVKKNSECLVQ